jgi:hypothetical protein
VGIPHPVGDGELGGVGGMVLAEDAEHAASFDGAVLGGIADEPQGGARLSGEPAQSVEVAVADGGGLVDDEHGAGVEGGGVGVVVGEVPGECLGGHAGGGAEGAGGFAAGSGSDSSRARSRQAASCSRSKPRVVARVRQPSTIPDRHLGDALARAEERF